MTWRMRLLATAAAITVLAVPAWAEPTYKDADPCDLLEPSEIEAAVGVEVAEPDDLGGGDTCYWFEAGADSGGVALVLDLGRGARSRFREAEAIKRDPVEVDGLGKDAYFILNELGVLKNKKAAFYLLGPIQVTELQAPLTQLADLVLERL